MSTTSLELAAGLSVAHSEMGDGVVVAIVANVGIALGGTKGPTAIPTLSEWGLIALTLAMLTAIAGVHRRHRSVAA